MKTNPRFTQVSFLKATADKSAVEAEATKCKDRLDLAERLTSGLSSENKRWSKEIENLKVSE